LDLAFDVAFDRQILTAVQLTLDDNRFSNVHHVPLDPPVLRLRYGRGADWLMRRRCWRRGRRWFRSFVTLPHVGFLRALSVYRNASTAFLRRPTRAFVFRAGAGPEPT